MKKLLIAFLLALTGSISYAELITMDLDWPVIEIEWQFIKQQVGAPNDLPMPTILVGVLPADIRMMFQFPIEDPSDYSMGIIISRETLENYGKELLNWGIGHELTHYAFIMRDNDWDYTKKSFIKTKLHHCDREFMHITKDIANIIYKIYHGQRERHIMLNQILRSCLVLPNQ